MRYLEHDSGGAATLKNGQVLGDDSPLEFDADGRSEPVGGDVATTLATMHRHVTLGERVDSTATCEAIKADGDVCGRELPCPYHSED
jgi:hypothetical protein